jgi:hypothetical protein
MAARVTTTFQRARGIADHKVIDDMSGYWMIRTIPFPEDGPAEGYRLWIGDPAILQPGEESAIAVGLEIINQFRRTPRNILRAIS